MQRSELEKLIVETKKLEDKMYKALLKVDENKKKIIEEFSNQDIKELEVEALDGVINAKVTERCTIKYDVEKLKVKLDKEIFNEITNRVYVVNDINALISLAKEAGIKASDLKKLLNIDIKVNTSRIKELYDAKEIMLSDLKGCYSAKINKAVKIVNCKG